MRSIILCAIIFLTACSSVEKLPEAPVIKYIPDDPKPVSVYSPKFYVLTEENAQKVLKEKKLLIAVSYDDSIELRKSMEDIETYIKIQNEIIDKLRK